ncbi:MAG: hypothetical protein RIQ53_3620 [Pseudomonadota bacterium]|jgi:tetraacyldisaccharide 4'-kinase
MPAAAGRSWRARLEQALLRQWQRPRPGPALWPLLPLQALHVAVLRLRRALYDHGLVRRHPAPRPLIVVGNLVAGGAGKTPTVLALLPLLRALGHRPGVISRGHGRREDPAQPVRLLQADDHAEDVGDEPLLIHLRGQVPVAVGRDRLRAAHALCEAHPELTVLVADDGLQHLRLRPDVSVLVFDDRGCGNGWCLPMGPLREPLPSRLPPRTLVLYSAGVASTAWPGHLGQRTLAGSLPLADWRRGLPARPLRRLMPTAAPEGARSTPNRLWAAAGLARPDRFFEMLRDAGLALERTLALPDHARLQTTPWPEDAELCVLVTEKDAVKLPSAQAGGTRLEVVRLDFDPGPAFGPALAQALQQAQAARAAAATTP